MPIPVSCPNCRATGRLPDEAAGPLATCPVCRTVFALDKPAPLVEIPDGLGVWVDSAPALPPAASASPPVAPNAEGVPVVEAGRPAAALDPDVATEPEWVKAEVRRFNTYMAGQLARLGKARLEIAEAESRHEATCVARTVELRRQAAVLEARRVDLDRRDGDLRQAADAVAAREVEVDRRAAALAEQEAAAAAGEDRRAKLEAEAVELSRLVAELRPVVERLELRKTEAEVIRAELAAKQTALDRRLIEVGRNELGMQKRMDELDELERTLRGELEEREAELGRQRAVLLEEIRSLRSRLPTESQTPLPRLSGDHPPRPAEKSIG
ncbi:MAG: hypothetical protein JWO38_5153 [Gemmataceae bacterium]|nr:hypothetical protein [Gemmataceae bacterium]